MKAANLYDYLMANLHRQITNMTDDMLAEGKVTQDERKLLSAALGEAMTAWDEFGQENFVHLRERGPWSDPEPAMSDVKCVKALGKNRLGGYMILWGDPDTTDLDNEWFTPQTEEMTSIFKSMGKLPYFYNHATDKTLKSSVIGKIDVMVEDDIGLWYEAQIEANNKYREAVFNLTSKKRLGTSSGTLPGARAVDKKTGRILRWPIVEGSATPTPADPRQISDRPISEIKSAYHNIGLDVSKYLAQSSSEKGVDIGAGKRDFNILAHDLWEIEILNALNQVR